MTTLEWWQSGTIYQVYPRSFQDATGDGVGDLRGITARLDYLVDLGVDAVWLSPIFPSPMKDFGYDVADYVGVDPLFGTLADFDALLAAAHARGLKIVLDFVPNHSSDAHPWFAESRRTRANPKRDWYDWRDPGPDGGPPNNWLGQFGGPAWTLDAATGQYYLHSFLPEQPDLNWRNPAVAAAMLDALRFWLERGVDGFRVDALHHVIKDAEFRDNPPNPAWKPGMQELKRQLPVYTTDRPELQEVIGAMRRLVERYPSRMLIGEIFLPLARIVAYYGAHGEGLHLPFNFQLLQHPTPWRGDRLAALIEAYESALPPGGWPNWVLGNHDGSRLASRLGPELTGVAALLLLTLRGTPTLYYGDELGMSDVPIPPALVQDPFEKNVPGLGLGRDPVRTPMPWNAGPQAGFSTTTPWLPLGADAATRNVEAQNRDPESLLALYRRLLALRRREPALAAGSYRTVAATPTVLAYLREAPDASPFLVVLNFGERAESVALPRGFAPHQASGVTTLSTAAGVPGGIAADSVTVAAKAGLLLKVRRDG